MNVQRTLVVALLVSGAVVPPAVGQEPPSRAQEIMREVDRRSRGWGDMEARLRMEIHRDGDVRTRVLDVQLLEAEDGDRIRLVIQEPADLAGTAFLSVRRADGERTRWMYLPSRRRARRIGGARSSDPFLGSHFTYADLDAPSLAGYDFRVVREETVAGGPGVVVERRPAGRTDGPRELLWIDTREYRLHRVEYHEDGGPATRTLVLDEYTTAGGVSRPTRMEMRQSGDGAWTLLSWSDIQVGVGLTEGDFDPRRMGG